MMKQIILVIAVFLVPFIILNGCSKDNSVPNANPPTGSIVTNLTKLEDALNHAEINFVNLIKKIRGSVGVNGPGSKVIWSRNNDYGLGLFISANHVYGINTWPSLNEEFVDLSVINNGIYIGSKIPATIGSITFSNELNANFGLYHPQISSNASTTTIVPKEDFYLGIIDNQRINDNGLGNYPNKVQTTTPLQMYDPFNRTKANHTWSVAHTNEIVVAVGYPQNKKDYPNGAVSAGKVYSDSEASTIIESLKAKGDPEGSIPYNSEVEFLANIEAIAGMSGGGVFNENGQLLGVMVRAAELNAEPVLRVVRISYIKQKINLFYNSLSVLNKNKISPFISGELN